ncbi:hypothetical protein CTEN210_15934 [Chaetoceros tenuissimus]|uniref:Uncharacterized protein n=1 Tax=Chaetoceros tenuissimus TaxID=426638 RepID=A0AAD3D831_9STRA|nr:hypothetical protein CTEN210_15934 [Chaetoceros tenuissimus]
MGGDLLTPSETSERVLRKEVNFWWLNDETWKRSDDFFTWTDECYACGKRTEAPKDLFCGNYWCKRESHQVCKRSWHPQCYKDSTDMFPIHEPEKDKDGLIWEQKKTGTRFIQARKGDMLSAQFQCEFCWFVNINKRHGSEFSAGDNEQLKLFRRAIFWSREPKTVSDILKYCGYARKNCRALGLESPLPLQGPYPVDDYCGMTIAMSILIHSLREGKNSKSHLQYGTLAKMRSDFVTGYDAAYQRNIVKFGVVEYRGARLTDSFSPTNSTLFDAFMLGMKKRTGRVINQNLGISVEVLLEILKRYDLEITDEDDELPYKRLRDIIVCGAAFVILFGASLRGNEVLMLERSEFVKIRNAGKTGNVETEHVAIPLMGRFKGETGDRNSLLVVARKSKSGIEFARWIDQLSAVLEIEDKSESVGPAICFENGSLMNASFLNAELHAVLLDIQSELPNLVDPSIDVKKKFSISRSFRRGATTRAREAGVSDSDIALINRWRSVQNNAGGLPNL